MPNFITTPTLCLRNLTPRFIESPDCNWPEKTVTMATPPVSTEISDSNADNAPADVEQAALDVPANPTYNRDANSSQDARGQAPITPEPRPEHLAMNSHAAQATPSTPGILSPFDWEDFQSRYEKALADADEEELAVLKDFERLSKVGPIAQIQSQ